MKFRCNIETKEYANAFAFVSINSLNYDYIVVDIIRDLV